MANYVQGIFSGQNADMTSNETGIYNLLVSGGQNYQKSSGIYIANNTNSKPGINVSFSSSNDMFIDHNASAGNKMNFRFASNGNNFTNMLILTNDMRTQTRGDNAYAGHFHGRVQATQYFINANGEDSMRSNGLETGLYMNSNTAGNFFITNVSQTVIDNNGTLFKFMATNATGDLHGNETQQWIDSDSNQTGLNRWRKDTKMEIFYNGIVQLPRYQKTTDAYDIDKTAFAGFDSKGNLVRDFKTNQRIRAIEEDVSTVNFDFMNGLTQKVNNIISRVNGLNFFSDTILEYRIPEVPFVVIDPDANNSFTADGCSYILSITPAISCNETTTDPAVTGAGGNGFGVKQGHRTDPNFWDPMVHGHITYTVETYWGDVDTTSNDGYRMYHQIDTGVEANDYNITYKSPFKNSSDIKSKITLRVGAEATATTIPPTEALGIAAPYYVAKTSRVLNSNGITTLSDLINKQLTVKVYAVAVPPMSGAQQHNASVHAPSIERANAAAYESSALYPDGSSPAARAANKSLKAKIRRVNPIQTDAQNIPGQGALKRK